MENALLVELNATVARLKIIESNTSDEITKLLSSDCVKHISHMTEQVENQIKALSGEES